MLVTIIVPVLNESESLPELHRQICEAKTAGNFDVEVLFIDDGSTDASWRVITDLSAADSTVSGIRFRRNFGKAAALTAGMRAAAGSIIVMMDADLQDDPAEISKFLAKLDEGYDVVNGWKQRRLDPWHKVYPSRVFNGMIGWLTGLRLHDHNCGLKAFRKEVAEEIRIYGELHRFIPVLAHARGFRVTELVVNHRPRQHGHSKYGIRRFLRGFLDLFTVKFLTGFGQRPLHLLGSFGVALLGLGGLGLTILAVQWVLTHLFDMGYGPIGSRPLLGYSIAATLLGAQAVSLGLLAELIIANTGHDRENYSVRERTLPPVTADVR